MGILIWFGIVILAILAPKDILPSLPFLSDKECKHKITTPYLDFDGKWKKRCRQCLKILENE